MGLYLKEFENHTQYENYINGSGAILPNVSICTTEGDVHYNPYVEPVETRVVAKYNVTSTSNPTQIGYYSYISGFSEIEIDGVVQTAVTSAYTFDTAGEHTVKYTLTDQTSIGNYAFYGCSGLTSIDIPSSVTSIGDGTFQNCSSLTSCTIGNSVTSIGNSAFIYCTGLTSIDIPNSVTSIGDSAFNSCISLTSINIPNSVTTIGSSAFRDCSGLTSCTIGSGVTTIGIIAFYGCSGLTSIDIPSSVTSIGAGAFRNCSGLTSITVDSNNTVYDSRNNCNAIIETATNALIQGCENTVIPSGVTTIGGNAFYNCSGLTSIVIPDSVTNIGNNAFYYCYSLTSCTIGNGVTSIGTYAFVSCTSLTSIVSNATTAPTIQSNTFQSIKTGGTLTVPIGSSGYDVWMGTGDYYLGKYNWTKIEQ